MILLSNHGFYSNFISCPTNQFLSRSHSAFIVASWIRSSSACLTIHILDSFAGHCLVTRLSQLASQALNGERILLLPCRRHKGHSFDPWVRRSLSEGGQFTPVFLPENSAYRRPKELGSQRLGHNWNYLTCMHSWLMEVSSRLNSGYMFWHLYIS